VLSAALSVSENAGQETPNGRSSILGDDIWEISHPWRLRDPRGLSSDGTKKRISWGRGDTCVTLTFAFSIPKANGALSLHPLDAPWWSG